MQEKIDRMSVSHRGTIRQAMHAIDRGALGMALLIDPDSSRFVGLVTDGDIRRALLSGLGLESPVASIQRPQPKVARAGTPAEQIATLFSEPVRIVPLLDEQDQVVNLVMFDRRMHLPVAEPSLGEKELLYVSECVLTGWVSSAGKFVTQFEEMFADFCGTRYAVATSNGTTALHLALLALNIGHGDEVIVPTLTFIATANAVTYTGARPVFVDSEPATWNIDPNRLEEAITPRTKAVIPVHLYGRPADMDQIMEVARRHNLAVVEDAAEAHGARYKDHRVGSLGDMGTFSFYGNKIITTGEGGMVVTNATEMVEKIRVLRDHGMSAERRYWHPVLGYNYRLTNLQAAIGVAQMEKIELILQAKQCIRLSYINGLRDLPGITVPREPEWTTSVCWLFSVLVDEREFGISRNELMQCLHRAGIDTRPLFMPVHKQPIYDRGETFPVAEKLAETGLSLPSAVAIRDEEIAKVCRFIWEFHIESTKATT